MDWRVPGYEHLAQVGEGGFGSTFLVRQLETGRVGVLKYVRIRDEAARDSFRRESAILKGVASPYVAQWYGHLEGPGAAAIFMEAVPGVSLRTLLNERGPLPPEVALTVLKGSLLGLGAAHVRGVVHRDYKPANVMVRPDDVSKLIDFGISGLAGESSRAGTPRYMAPEQWSGEPLGAATDVYAATCVFVECLTGAPPFPMTDPTALRAAHLLRAPDLAAVPGQLRPLVDRGMAKRTDDRPADAASFVADLEPIAVAACGSDWESRGWAFLRSGAIALAALAPLAVAGAGLAAAAGGGAAGGAAGGVAAGAQGGTALGGTAAGAHGGTALGGTAAGAQGGTAAGGTAVSAQGGTAAAGSSGVSGSGGLAAAGTGTKVGLIAAGVATAGLVGTAGVLVTNRTGNHHAAKAAGPIVTADATFQTPAGSWLTGSYITVRGGDAVLTARINAALRRPLDGQAAAERTEAATTKHVCPAGTTNATPTVTLNRPALLAVSYKMQIGSCVHDGASGVVTVAVDPRTGRTLTPKDILRPGVLTSAGIGPFIAALTRTGSSDGGICGAFGNDQVLSALNRANSDVLAQGTEPISFTATGIVVWNGIEHLCGDVHWQASYTAVRSFLTPAVAAAV